MSPSVRIVGRHELPALARRLGPGDGPDAAARAALLARLRTAALEIGGLDEDGRGLLAGLAARAGVAAAPLPGGPGTLALAGSRDGILALALVLRTGPAALPALADGIEAALRAGARAPVALSLPGGGSLLLGGPTVVMGVINVTPDSFSDGGRHLDPELAVRRGLEMVAAGAGVLDVGGESTRPGAADVDPAEEQARILPVIERLAKETEVPISVDTRRGDTARAALRAGARIVNDVSALDDPRTGPVAAAAGAPLVLMHMRGTPADMGERCGYGDVVRDVAAELMERVRRAVAAGVPESQVVLDPGIGFAKTAEQSMELLRRLPELAALGRPLLVGPSRKSFLRTVRDAPPDGRRDLTIGAVLAAVANGAAVVRVHDVGPVVDAVRAFEAAGGAPALRAAATDADPA